jgi:cyclase
MILNRFIPCLLLKNSGLVKTKQFSKYKYIGDPINAIKIFNDKYVDEIIILDIEASKEKRGPNFTMLESLASECFIPLAYGGGISSLKEIEQLIQIGIEKIILNHSALHSNSFVSDAISYFGSSTIIGAIDVKKNIFGQQRVYDHVTKKNTSFTPVFVAKKYAELGVGEIFLNNVDLDGTMLGYDLNLIKEVSEVIQVSLIASGGASSKENMVQAIYHGASAASAGALFVFQGPHNAVLINYPFES